MRESFIIYRSFYDAIKDLKADEQGTLWTAICEYSLNKKEIELSGICATIFKLIKPQLEANYKRYDNGVKYGKLGAEHGKKGGRPKTPKKPSKNPQKRGKEPSNVNDNDNLNLNQNVNPNVIEVQQYFESNGYSKDVGTRFFNYYDVSGWKDSNGNQVKNWKQKAQAVWFKPENKTKEPEYYKPRFGNNGTGN